MCIEDQYNTRARKGKYRLKPTHKEKIAIDLNGTFKRNREPKALNPMNERQSRLIQCVRNYEQTVVFGPSGTGKTFLTVSLAAEMFLTGKVKKIVITRPIVGTGKSIGALPGELEDKMNPWLAETITILKDRLGTGTYEVALSSGEIEIAPLEYIRGRTFNNTFVLMTEAQNSTIDEMKALVTRIGEDSKIILDGDVRQTDLKGDNGLLWAIELIRDTPSLQKMTGIVEFQVSDIVRSGLCAEWVKAIWGGR
jgi:phosphate starvation-inducible PhoH-like protein